MVEISNNDFGGFVVSNNILDGKLFAILIARNLLFTIKWLDTVINRR